jgi:DNA-binding PadR family transcriptional regulator
VSLASIYYALSRLEEKGYIKPHQEKVGKMPARTVYELTSKGEKQLSRLVEKALITSKIPEDDFSVGIAFMYGLEKDKVVICLDEKMRILHEYVKNLNKDLRCHEGKIPFNWSYLIRNAIAHLELEIDHLRKLNTFMKKGRNWTDLIKTPHKRGGRS